MRLLKTYFAAAILFLLTAPRITADEENAVTNILSSTTLSGFVDTSAGWSVVDDFTQALAVFSPVSFRFHETTIAEVFGVANRRDLAGFAGATALLFVKTETWFCAEAEPIRAGATAFLKPDLPGTTQVRIVFFDEDLPPPVIRLSVSDRSLKPVLTGLPGQRCAISFSSDLFGWSTPQAYRLTNTDLELPAIETASVRAIFYRTTQSLP